MVGISLPFSTDRISAPILSQIQKNLTVLIAICLRQ